MCEGQHEANAAPGVDGLGAGVSRRALLRGALTGGAALAMAPLLGVRAAEAHTAATASPTIIPRSSWAGSTCPPMGPLPVESTGNVKFLLVHHTAVPGNTYASADVPAMLRGMYRYHTGTKGWPEIAYNFFVDRYGRIWEGRAGSLTTPVIPSATGGTQGFSQIACFIGDHTTTAPTAAAAASMTSILAWLARRYQVDPRPQARVTFTSRGSNRWPQGTVVTTRTLEGHRAMSLTACPGDAADTLVRNHFPADVSTLLGYA